MSSNKEELMKRLKERIRNCKKCHLWETRTNAVPGNGNLYSEIMFVGEAPGYNEDVQGKPFVGAAGKLLNELLISIGLKRDDVYITNVVKCRPPNNRDPKSDEIAICSPYLDEEIQIIAPKVIVTLGRHSTKYLLSKVGLKSISISRIHGRTFNISSNNLKVLVIPTFHPAAALYNPRLKNILVNDFKIIGSIIRGPRRQKLLDDFF